MVFTYSPSDFPFFVSCPTLFFVKSDTNRLQTHQLRLYILCRAIDQSFSIFLSRTSDQSLGDSKDTDFLSFLTPVNLERLHSSLKATLYLSTSRLRPGSELLPVPYEEPTSLFINSISSVLLPDIFYDAYLPRAFQPYQPQSQTSLFLFKHRPNHK